MEVLSGDKIFGSYFCPIKDGINKVEFALVHNDNGSICFHVGTQSAKSFVREVYHSYDLIPEKIRLWGYESDNSNSIVDLLLFHYIDKKVVPSIEWRKYGGDVLEKFKNDLNEMIDSGYLSRDDYKDIIIKPIRNK